MTLLDKGASVFAWTKAATAVLCLLGALLVAGYWALREHRGKVGAEDALARAAEAAEADRLGLIRSHEVEAAELGKSLDAAEKRSAGFKAALDGALSKLRGAKVVSVVTASTGPQPVHPAPGTAPTPGADPACVMTEADQGEIWVTSAVLAMEAGTKVVVGTAEAYRVTPHRFLFDGPFSAPLTEATEIAPAPARKPGWGAGPLAGLSSAGGQLGLLAATPEGGMPLLGGRIFGVVGGVAGSGQFTLLGAAIWRP